MSQTQPRPFLRHSPRTLLLNGGTLDDLALRYHFVAELEGARAAADDPDNYYHLLPHLSGIAALAALEAVEDDIVAEMVLVTVQIAEKWVLPCIAADHVLRPVAVDVVETYKSWLVDGGSAVLYSGVAWCLHEERDDDLAFEYLVEALPGRGVDIEVGQGPQPAEHWRNFGEYLRCSDPVGREINEIDEALFGATPTAPFDGSNNWWMGVLAERSFARMAELMKPHDDQVRAMIVNVLEQ